MSFKVGYLTPDFKMCYIDTISFAAAAGTADALSGKTRFIILEENNKLEVLYTYSATNNQRYQANKELIAKIQERGL